MVPVAGFVSVRILVPASKFKSDNSFVALKSKSAVVWVSKLVCTKAIAVSASDSFVSISLCSAASAASALVSSAVIAELLFAMFVF